MKNVGITAVSYTHLDLGGLSASGITRLQEHPYLQLKGSGTAVAVVDSGIDYRNPVFQNEMGSRILCIWDQTLEGDGKEVPYGRVSVSYTHLVRADDGADHRIYGGCMGGDNRDVTSHYFHASKRCV